MTYHGLSSESVNLILDAPPSLQESTVDFDTRMAGPQSFLDFQELELDFEDGYVQNLRSVNQFLRLICSVPLKIITTPWLGCASNGLITCR